MVLKCYICTTTVRATPATQQGLLHYLFWSCNETAETGLAQPICFSLSFPFPSSHAWQRVVLVLFLPLLVESCWDQNSAVQCQPANPPWYSCKYGCSCELSKQTPGTTPCKFRNSSLVNLSISKADTLEPWIMPSSNHTAGGEIP